MTSVLRARVVGPGRAGTAFALALGRKGWDVAGPVGRRDISGAAHGVDVVLLAVPDHAIADVAAAIEPVPTTAVAHLSGSLGLDVLAPHTRRAAVHPLVALPNGDVGADRLVSGAWFALAVGGDPLGEQVVAALGGRSFTVADADRARYHAAAVVASNHLVALLDQVTAIAPDGVPPDAYLDLVRVTVENVAAMGAKAALTGPAARGDDATIERHLAAIDPAERALYEILSDRCRQIATSP